MENEKERKIAGGAEILAWSGGGGGSGMTQGERGRGQACAVDTQNNAADESPATMKCPTLVPGATWIITPTSKHPPVDV